MNNVILLTATISPKENQDGLVVVDHNERLKQYLYALDYYVGLLDSGVVKKILFVENSGYDLSFIREGYSGKSVELISFYGLDYDDSYHRGYGEFNLINFAYENSRTLNDIDVKDCVWKISGRYIVRNMVNMINTKPKNIDLYINKKNDSWVDMELLSWNRCGYDACVCLFEEWFKNSLPPETLLAKRIDCNSVNMKVVHEFTWLPDIYGTRGTDGSKFHDRNKFKFFLIKMLRVLRNPNIAFKLKS